MDRTLASPPGGPMMPPPMPPMGMGGPPPAPPPEPPADINALLKKFEAIVGPVTTPKPRYRAGYKPPPKPKQEAIWGLGTTIRQKHQKLLDRFWSDKLWMRMALVGMFEEDILAKNEGATVDEWQSNTVASEWNKICYYGAALPFNPIKKMLREDLATEARQLQDAVRYLRDEEVNRYGDAYGSSLEMDEWRYLTMYGRIVNRTVVNLDDPDFPFDSVLIDPSTVFFRGDDRNIEQAFHRYKTTYRKLIGTFGEPAKKELKKLKQDYGNTEWMDVEVDALDYWDTWYRSVVTDSCVILPVTAHEYGMVPFTIQYGPNGEPVSSNPVTYDPIAKRSGELWAESGNLAADTVNQGLSYIHYIRRTNAQFEAIMARMVTGFKKAIDPPLIHTVDPMNPVDRPKFDTGVGAVNEVPVGNELSPVPTVASPIEVNTVLTAITQQMDNVGLPAMATGGNMPSNTSGSAANGVIDAGMNGPDMWRKCMERYHARRFGQWLTLWRNFGYLAQYGGKEKQPLLIPSQRPRDGEATAFELTRELIDRVKPTISVQMSEPRKQELLAITNAYTGMVSQGWATDRMAAEALGFTDFDRIREEWMEDKALKQALDHPKFVESVSIPQAFMASIKEAEGNPDLQQTLTMMLSWWIQNVAMPNQMQQQQTMQQMQNPQPPQGQLGAGPPQGPPGGMMGRTGPGGGPGISFQDMGQGPGSVTGQRPGGPPPAPPGSIVIPPGQGV